MCIRDRGHGVGGGKAARAAAGVFLQRIDMRGRIGAKEIACLLYTSDAADERSSVDLGGRRIIKKKKEMRTRVSVESTLSREQESNKSQ